MDIMEVDAQRQMEREMKDALLAVLYRKRFNLPFLILKVRRDHLIEDSLNQVGLLTWRPTTKSAKSIFIVLVD
jgi:hypothetical protein